ncbi:MAG: glycosyltransferase [Bacteroidales bacterium]|nr:glycosyltransferase [Bacteroidales bacterium]
MDSERRLHIIAFDNPWPPDYGGVIDIFYKLKSLAEHGVRITLHIFEYGRGPATEMQKYCDRIFYYPRKKLVNPFSLLPYITASRNHPRLITNLMKDDAPVLFEGLHTCLLLDHPVLGHRVRIVRMHNIEHRYYWQTARLEKNPVLKLWHFAESLRLKRFERRLCKATAILAISENDFMELAGIFPATRHVGPFHSNEMVTSETGRGDYALYHAKLSVAENNRAALFLAREVFRGIGFKLVIAGSNPSKELMRAVDANPSATIIVNPSDTQINELIKEAHINVMPSFQTSGIKLKLINALYRGRFVLTNRLMVEGTGCEPLCEVAETTGEFRSRIEVLSMKPFEPEEAVRRALLLKKLFDNDSGARAIIRIAGI